MAQVDLIWPWSSLSCADARSICSIYLGIMRNRRRTVVVLAFVNGHVILLPVWHKGDSSSCLAHRSPMASSGLIWARTETFPSSTAPEIESWRRPLQAILCVHILHCKWFLKILERNGTWDILTYRLDPEHELFQESSGQNTSKLPFFYNVSQGHVEWWICHTHFAAELRCSCLYPWSPRPVR